MTADRAAPLIGKGRPAGPAGSSDPVGGSGGPPPCSVLPFPGNEVPVMMSASSLSRKRTAYTTSLSSAGEKKDIRLVF